MPRARNLSQIGGRHLHVAMLMRSFCAIPAMAQKYRKEEIAPMRKRQAAFAFPLPALAVLGICACVHIPDTKATLSKRLDAFHSLAQSQKFLDSSEQHAMIERTFERLLEAEFSADALEHTGDADLEAVFAAAKIRAFYSNNGASLHALNAAHAELGRRHALKRRHSLDLFQALIWHRKFDEAIRLRASEKLQTPEFSFRSNPAVSPVAWKALDDGARIQSVARGEIDDRSIIVVAHPYCAFSQHALASIDRNDTLKEIFMRKAVIITPPKSDMALSTIQTWNKDHPELTMLLADSERDWPQVKHWETPTFYFMKGESVETVIVGWPSDERIDALLSATIRNGEPRPEKIHR